MKTAVKPILYLLLAAVISVGLLFGAEAVTASLLEKGNRRRLLESCWRRTTMNRWTPALMEKSPPPTGRWMRRGGCWAMGLPPRSRAMAEGLQICGAQRRRRPFCRYPDRGEP